MSGWQPTETLPDGACRYFVATHPDLFRPNHPALITDIRVINGRECFHLLYPDGVEDDTPVENEDCTGKGGIGYFYDILSKAEARALKCRHAFECEGWTVDPQTSVCRVCRKPFVFWSEPQNPDIWNVK